MILFMIMSWHKISHNMILQFFRNIKHDIINAPNISNSSIIVNEVLGKGKFIIISYLILECAVVYLSALK